VHSNQARLSTNRGMAGEQGQPNQREFCGFMERAMGIEPTSEAWEASNKNLKALELAALSESDGRLK